MEIPLAGTALKWDRNVPIVFPADPFLLLILLLIGYIIDLSGHLSIDCYQNPKDAKSVKLG